MKINSTFTGTLLKDYVKQISWRNTTNYAAAISDYNPCYFNDESESGIVAHPMHCVAATWPVMGKIWEFIESDTFPKEILMTQVHHTEHIVIHRLIKPEDVLTFKGRIAAIIPHRSGTRAVIMIEAFDSFDNPVFTEYTGAMLRGVECTDTGAGSESLPVVPDGPDKDSDVLWETVIPISPIQPYIYDGCTDIIFPIHTSPRFARQVGLPDIILQGTATLAFGVREIVNREAEGDPNIIAEISCRFSGMVLPGTDIKVICTGVNEAGNGKDVFFKIQNADGAAAVNNGYIKIKRGEGYEK